MKRPLFALAAFLFLLAAGLSLSSVVWAAPTLPLNVMAQPVSPKSSTIELTWDAPSGDDTVAKYWTNMRELPDGQFVDPKDRMLARSVKYGGLKPVTTYEFQVQACTGTDAPAKAGSDCSATVTATATTDALPPSTPTNLMAQAGEEAGIADSNIRLTWDASTSDGGKPITHYEIRRRTPGGTWASADTARVDPPFTDPLQFDYTGTASQAYEFRVAAYNSDTTFANASSSDVVSILGRPGVPTNVIYTRTSSTTVSISWDPPDNTGGAPLTGYQYEHSSDNGGNWTEAGMTSDTSTPVSGLMPGADYLFRVRAENADRNSVYSANALLEQDYDADGDGLIDIQTLAELNAIRWDADGNGVADDSDDATAYTEAFPDAAPGMGCADTNADNEPGPCAGYELAADLDFDTGVSGDRTDDDYYNGGFGWLPIETYSSVLDGNGRAIANLHVNRPSSESGVGLFSFLGGGSVVRDLGLTGVDVNGRSRVGGLAGISFGTINGSYSVGTVRGRLGNTGGLVGDHRGVIINSHALGAVHGNSQVGGLVGSNNVVGRGVTGSYAAGTVTGRTQVGGLIGRNNDTVSRSFAAGTVTGSSIHIGGLVGENGGISIGDTGNIIASYAMAAVSGHSRVGGLVGANLNTGRIITSYAAGTVRGVAPESVEIGGLYGVLNLASRDFSGELTASYHDQDLSGIADDHGRTTDELTGPTGYAGIYAGWNRDLDGDSMNDAPWDFGADGEYPALRADWNADATATWQEFGYQTRRLLDLEVTRDSDSQASVGWEDITETGWTGSPQASYVLYRDGETLDDYEGQLLRHTGTGLTAGQHYVYQVALLLDGVEFRRSREVSTEAASLTTSPSPLTERTLNGARLTVDLARAEYESELLPEPEHFELQPATVGLSIASVDRVNNTRAILTLAFGGNIGSDLELSVMVGSAATIEGDTLRTDSVTVTPAPPPDQVTGVNATGGSASVDVTWAAADNADGYVVQWRLAGEVLYERSVSVPGGLTTRTTLSDLLYETAYEVQVYATSHFAADGPTSETVTATTLVFEPPPPPADAIVWHTVPCPLGEANLDGSTITLALLDRADLVWSRNPRASHFTPSGVPGVSVTGIARLSDNQVALVLAYDDTDFDEDATLMIRIDEQALYSGGPIRATTRIEAVVEEPPFGQVTGVRVTPGPRRITVNWDALPGAHGYKVQWRRQGQDWRTDRFEVSGRQRTLEGLIPGTEYTVRVFATRDKAPYGEPSEAVVTATPAFEAAITATEPSSLNELNLNEATLTIDLRGAEWELNVHGPRLVLGRHLIQPELEPDDVQATVWVEYVERVSASRLKVILGYRWEDFDTDATLKLVLHEDTNGWAGTSVTVPVKAFIEAEGNARKPVVTAKGGYKEIDVSWASTDGTPIDGATTYKLEWKGPGEGYDGNRRVVTPATSHIISKGLSATSTTYTIRVAAWIPPYGYVDVDGVEWWSDEVTATTLSAPAQQQANPTTQPQQQQRAGVTVEPVRVTLPEGWTGSYGLSLDAEPDVDVSIAMSSDNPDVVPYPNPVIFTRDNWQTRQLIGVPAGEDDDAVDDTATVSHTVSGGGYDGVTVESVTVTITDEDTAGITVSETSLDVPEGGSATYRVSLSAAPAVGEVGIFVTAHGDGVTVQPAELTFTPDNWNAQTVTVSAAQDENTADETAAVTHSLWATAGSGYVGIEIPNIVVTVTDGTDPNRAALSALYNATGGDNWATSTNWLSEQPLDQWHGVTVDGQGQVTELVLDGNSLSGTIPSELGSLYNLIRLAMNRNGLSGAIPSELGNLSSLSILGLARNSLSGALPTSLGNLSGLTKLSLHDNTGLSGALPESFVDLGNLQRLAVSNTGLCAPAGDAFTNWLATVTDLTPSAEEFARCE